MWLLSFPKSYLKIHRICMKVLVGRLCLTLCDSMDYIALQSPLSMGFPRQKYWNGLPFPSPGDLPDPVIKSGSPILQEDSLPSGPHVNVSI